jgi:hypothetical protein
MAPATISLIAFLALTVWRSVFTGLQSRRLVRRRRNGLLGQGLLFDREGLAVAASNLGNGSDGLDRIDRNDRARTYLRCIVALTGAKRMGSGYFLDVGTTRFEVRDRYIRRVRDATDPKCAYEETCFYPAYQEMPKAERIATALLQLRNNPALFEKWAVQRSLAFKADGQSFTRAQ